MEDINQFSDDEELTKQEPKDETFVLFEFDSDDEIIEGEKTFLPEQSKAQSSISEKNNVTVKPKQYIKYIVSEEEERQEEQKTQEELQRIIDNEAKSYVKREKQASLKNSEIKSKKAEREEQEKDKIINRNTKTYSDFHSKQAQKETFKNTYNQESQNSFKETANVSRTTSLVVNPQKGVGR